MQNIFTRVKVKIAKGVSCVAERLWSLIEFRKSKKTFSWS